MTPQEQADENKRWWETATYEEKRALLINDLMKCRCRCHEYYAAHLGAPIRPCNSCGPIRASLQVIEAEKEGRLAEYLEERSRRVMRMKWTISDGGPGTVNVWAWPLGRKRRIKALLRSQYGWYTFGLTGPTRTFPTLREAVRFALSTIKEVK